MLQSYTMKKKQSRNRKFPLLFLYIIIPFLTFFFYLITIGHIPPFAVLGIFVNVPPKVEYETFKISFDDSVPSEIEKYIVSSVDDIALDGKKRFEFVEKGDYVIKYSKDVEVPVYAKEYIPVGHMYWVKGETSLEDLKSVKGIYVSSNEYEFAKGYFPELVGSDITVVSAEDMAIKLKSSEEYIGFVTSNELSSDLKVLSWEDGYIFNDDGGSLKLRYALEGGKRNEFVKGILSRNIERKYGESVGMDLTNVAKINMSGVVAMSRGLASKMDSLKNYEYPARDLGEFLSDADLTHISNEVSFVEGCTGYTGMRFCSNPKYIETLKKSGVDIVELTGNHNNDYGSTNNANTIQVYNDLGWDHFGGGLDITDASKILYKEVKGSTIAFVGYNYYDTMLNTGAIASDTHAGANSYSVAKLERDIKIARENADVVIVTFQFQECYSYPDTDVIYPICYKPLSSPDQKGVFRKAIDLGANMVVGTQAHQPQTYEVYKDGLIFYGLGNLYFDQYRWIGTRQGIILSLYVKDGKLIQVKMTPTIMDRDLIPRVAGESDSNLLLNLLKSARTF